MLIKEALFFILFLGKVGGPLVREELKGLTFDDTAILLLEFFDTCQALVEIFIADDSSHC